MLTYERVTDVPAPTSEYVWALGRHTGHVWKIVRDGKAVGWGATVRGVKTYGTGRTRREAIVSAIRKALRRQTSGLGHPSV